MSLETGTFIQDLVSTNPPGTDKKKQGDDHLRLIKSVLRSTFPNSTKAFYLPVAVTKTTNYTVLATDMNGLIVADATAGALSITLPTLAAGDSGWAVRVVKSDASANNVTVVGTINGATNYITSLRYREATFIWSGSAWFGMRSFSTEAQLLSGEISDNAITNAKMADDAVNTAEIVNLAVTSGKLADNSVTTAKMLDGNTTNAKLAGPRKTMQELTSGTGATYTTPAGCHTLHVKMIGAGGGGGAGSTNNGSTGGTTTFNGVTAIGGGGGDGGGTNDLGGVGGTGGSGGTFRRAGSAGENSSQINSINDQHSGRGAPGIFGTGGTRSVRGSTAGNNAAANTGAGGSGGSSTNIAGGGGGAGEYVEIYIQSPAATYTYTITAGGAGGTAGGQVGGNGGSGVIIVEEYY
jgi:hypothetical protein